MNTKLVESLVQIIHTLSAEERSLLEEKLFFDSSEPSPSELINLALQGKAFDFLFDEPDLYSLEDGEPVT
ncbi:MAG: hypothetical protein HC899_36120 [Leptolyngbyaceae cyanobacterium SM1_4_3]|nr:hypothetical protein [Leptolyngbyaceae cyanobacterium SM1_4_3]